MKTKYLFIAAIGVVTLASCADDVFVGDNSPNVVEQEATNTEGMINFGFEFPNMTRADIYGSSAADLLSNRFYVTGTKGKEKATHPTDSLVFDNYLVMYTANTAGTTASNTANWEYVGLAPGQTSGVCKDSLKLSAENVKTQAIKYWDYSHLQYDFLAFSTGKYKAVSAIDPNDNTKTKLPTALGTAEIGVTAMKYGDELVNSAVAYTFVIPSVQALKNTYITDITEVARANFGKEVTLKFKNLGSKVRVALYETVPGYSILASSVQFYTVDGTTDFSGAKGTNAALISAETSSFASAGTLTVSFPNIGTDNHTNTNYDKAATTVTSSAGATSKTFGALENKAGKEGTEADGAYYLGRSLPEATFAGLSAADYYETVFPVSTGHPLTLRVDYQLVATDGSGETINVFGAKAVVPATYTVWQPNYAYTYIFKITDNTNGWTTPADATADNQGLYPITFDAVVAEATDASGKQTTITTVAAPTITTYQQNHNALSDKKPTTNEYSKAIGKNIYVQVMDNSTTTPTLKTDLNGKTPENKDKSLLYKLSDDKATEAIVMDALEKRTATYVGDAATITGRNGLVLTKQTIDNTVTQILNGVDDNPIELTDAGKAAMITIATGTSGALDAGTYAYVYDYTTLTGSATARTEITEFQPIVPGSTYVIDASSSKVLATVTTTYLGTLTPEATAVDLTAAGAMDYIYFSKTTNGTGTTTYSYISVTGKTSLPAGVVKVSKTDSTNIGTANGNATPAEGTFYFDKYFSNEGKYAVKVIKVV